MVLGAMPQPRTDYDLRVLTGVKWLFFEFVVVSIALFLFEPDFREHPQLLLLASTGLVGTLTLYGLSRVLRRGPR
jgi:hypothetical protein